MGVGCKGHYAIYVHETILLQRAGSPFLLRITPGIVHGAAPESKPPFARMRGDGSAVAAYGTASA